MKKTYIIEGLRGYKLYLKGYSIQFRSSNILRPCCFYTTAKAEIQEAIEESKSFKAGGIAIYSISGEAESEPRTIEVKDNNQVKTMTAAINILVSKHGADESKLNTIDDVILKARECGIRFVKLEEKYGSKESESDREDEAKA